MFDDLKKQKPDQSVNKNNNRWRPTNYGNYPKVRFRPSVATSAYMVLHDVGVEPSAADDNNKKHLWVYDVVFGWTMNYTQSQTVFGKSFYPRHMQVGNVVVKCQTASQHHYDEIVDMVLHYQQNSVLATTDSGSAYKIVRFEIPEAKYQINSLPRKYERTSAPLSDNNAIYKYERIWFDGYPISISAGHRKNTYQPEIELTFAILSYKNDLDILSRVQSQRDPENDPLSNSAIQKLFKDNIANDPEYSGGRLPNASAQSGYTELPNGSFQERRQ